MLPLQIIDRFYMGANRPQMLDLGRVIVVPQLIAFIVQAALFAAIGQYIQLIVFAALIKVVFKSYSKIKISVFEGMP